MILPTGEDFNPGISLNIQGSDYIIGTIFGLSKIEKRCQKILETYKGQYILNESTGENSREGSRSGEECYPEIP
jgi:hypothetical protein